MATRPRVDEKGQMELMFHLLDLKINEKHRTVSSNLKLPSKLPSRYDTLEQGQSPAVFLDLYCKNKDGKRCCKVMKEIIHPNILHARGIHKSKSESQLLLWVEPYTGNLLDYIERSLGKGPSLPKSKRTLLPTQILRKIVRQIIDGMNYLRMQGSYHFFFERSSAFQLRRNRSYKYKKGGERSMCQSEDLKALGTELTLVSSTADKLNKKNMTGHIFDCTLLDDLANMLKLVAQTNLDNAYKKIKKHPFFWEINERKRFFVYRVALKMKSQSFQSKVEKCVALCSLPWNLDDHNGFLQKMNHFRSERNEPDYWGFSRCDFVRFVCGLYTHEHETTLQNKGQKVDETVTVIHPNICLILSNLMQSDDEDWL